jgi:hypothetical protein
MTDLRTRRCSRILAIAFGATLAMAVAASAGTMFRLEIGPAVAAGTDFKQKGAVLAVRALVCDDLDAVRVTGTAEGIVNGARQSMPLRLIPIATAPGVFVVQQQWPAQGQWVLHLAGTCPASKAQASTIVPMRRAAFIREKTQVLREPATRAQIDAALAELVRTES